MKRLTVYLTLTVILIAFLFTACASQAGLCYPNLTTQNTALGSQLGASIQEQVTGSIGWVGLVSGGIGPLVWNAVMVSGCPPTTPVQVQPVKAKLVMVP